MLARRIDIYAKTRKANGQIQILDMCTGSGCIALNLAASLRTTNVRILGLDHSQKAVNLALQNRKRTAEVISSEVELEFSKADLFCLDAEQYIEEAEVIAMNPPYILQEETASISLSVRRYEPRDALVPSRENNAGEIFYERILKVLKSPKRRAQLLAFEIGTESQAIRVRDMIIAKLGWQCEIIKDAAGQHRSVFAESLDYSSS